MCYRLGIWCGILLLFAASSPPTTWVAKSAFPANAPQITEGFSWLWIASALGLFALAFLIVGQAMRCRALGSVVCFSAATVAFAIAAVGLTHYWIDLMAGRTGVQAGIEWELRPAPFVLVFALLALLGGGCALMPVIGRFRPMADADNDC